jgi:type I restriction enzyme S subunit
MEDWKPTRIGNICKTNQRTYSVTEKWPFVNYLDTGNITENRVSEIQHIVVGQDTLPSRARRKVSVDDILYSTVRPNQRHYGIVRDVLPNMLVSTGFTVITVDKEKADSDFLYYYLTQNDIVDSLHAIGEQSVSAYPSIKPSDIESVKLLLPPLSEQIEIGRTLRALDAKIANNTKINNHLEQMAQAIFKSWFVDFEPFGGVMPDDWRNALFSEFLTPRVEKIISDDSTPMLSVTNSGVMLRDKKFNKNLASSSTKVKLAKYGDLVFGNSRHTLNWGVVRIQSGGVSSVYNVFLVAADVCIDYLESFMKANIGYFSNIIRSTTRDNQSIDIATLMQKELYLPSSETLDAYYTIERPLTNMVKLIQSESSRLAELRDTLLPRLMSGELSVADVALQ